MPLQSSSIPLHFSARGAPAMALQTTDKPSGAQIFSPNAAQNPRPVEQISPTPENPSSISPLQSLSRPSQTSTPPLVGAQAYSHPSEPDWDRSPLRSTNPGAQSKEQRPRMQPDASAFCGATQRLVSVGLQSRKSSSKEGDVSVSGWVFISRSFASASAARLESASEAVSVGAAASASFGCSTTSRVSLGVLESRSRSDFEESEAPISMQ